MPFGDRGSSLPFYHINGMLIFATFLKGQYPLHNLQGPVRKENGRALFGTCKDSKKFRMATTEH